MVRYILAAHAVLGQMWLASEHSFRLTQQTTGRTLHASYGSFPILVKAAARHHSERCMQTLTK